MGSLTIMTGRGPTRHRYKQGQGSQRRRKRGCGPKLTAFKGFMKKGLTFGKKHILPHIKEIGKTYDWMPLRVVTLVNHLNHIQSRQPSIH